MHGSAEDDPRVGGPWRALGGRGDLAIRVRDPRVRRNRRFWTHVFVHDYVHVFMIVHDCSNLGAQVNQAEMVVGAAGHELVAALGQLVRHRRRVLQHLLLVLLELGGGCLLEGDGQSGDGVVVGPALESGEDREVDLVLNVVHDLVALLVYVAHALPEEDHGTARPAQRLVSGGGDDIGMLEGRRHEARGDQSGDVRHVSQQPRVVLISDLAHASVVNGARVGGGASDQKLRTVQFRVLLHLVVVDEAGLLVQAVRERLEED
mmetsp:Transcript_9452/g.16238  ORF Transcript_9452/g.16238 Transcript_9452/m.16238 type:complete len:262 (+) Transcript_9452:77-862(+)